MADYRRLAARLLQIGERAVPVRRASDDIYDVMGSNFEFARPAGNRMAPIEGLTGGVRMDDPQQIDRVRALADQITGPRGYFARPIADDVGNILEGQHRLEALRMLGASHVPVTGVRDLSRGFDTGAMRAAITGRHPDQVHGIMRSTLEAIADAGSPQAALRDYSVPGFEREFEAALNAIINQRR